MLALLMFLGHSLVLHVACSFHCLGCSSSPIIETRHWHTSLWATPNPQGDH